MKILNFLRKKNSNKNSKIIKIKFIKTKCL